MLRVAVGFGVIPAKRLLDEVIASLRGVIAPAIAAPYPKTQAYMAATILEIVARAVDERGDVAETRRRALERLFADLETLGVSTGVPDAPSAEGRAAALVERVHAARASLGEERFAAAHRRLRAALRELLDADLAIAGGEE